MAGRLAGRVALISGAARGQGAAEARLFAREGAAVVLGDVLEAEAKERAAEIRAAGDRAEALRLDVTRAEDWEAAVALAERRFGRLDVLVNNAGILDTSGVEATTPETWQRVIAVNQTGVWLGMRAALPALRRAGGGSIINVSSVFGLIGSGGSAAYHASKGAVRLLSKTAAIEYAPENIRVNSIHPGVIETPMLDALPAEARPALRSLTPLGRNGSPEDVAYGALYLASEESAFVTGSELVIDGGLTAR